METHKNIDFKIVFMGTPGFAVSSLEKLYINGIRIEAVVTSTDKPAGRGQKIQFSEVKQFAIEKNLPLLQPEKLKDPQFLQQLSDLEADLFVVVAFRMLPEAVWKMPAKGTINLHASLLPQYRGAAPINWAVINGEKESGVTTFFISHEIDTGNIIAREKVSISENETAGELHDELAQVGAGLLLKTVCDIRDGKVKAIPQDEWLKEYTELKHAPKIFREDCRINWKGSAEEVHNHIRGLSPYPAAFTEIKISNQPIQLKIFRTSVTNGSGVAGVVETDNKTWLKIYTGEGAVLAEEVQLAGKKRMSVEEFLRGTKIPGGSVCI